MDNTTIIIVIAIFALVIIVVAILFRGKIRASIKGPGGLGVDVEAANEPRQPAGGATIKGARSHGGGVEALDHTGQGASITDAEAEKDIRAVTEYGREQTDPKE